jgi:peptide/nickel transport system substrate-binding protein
MDPHSWDPAYQELWFLVFDNLMHQEPDGKLIPWLATEWKNLSPTVWQFKLRSDVQFQNGDPFTADDVVATFARLVTPGETVPLASRVVTVQQAEKIDATTVNIVFKAPDPLALVRISRVPILPGKYFAQVGAAGIATKPIGTGLFKVTEWVPENKLVVENVGSHPFRKSALQKLTFRVLGESAVRVAALTTGEVDWINAVAFDDADSLQQGGMTVETIPAANTLAWGLPWGEGPAAYKDTRVRQAINYAVNKDAQLAIFRGASRIEDGQLVQPATFGYNPDVKAYPYDPVKAKQLLTEAGYPNGFDTIIEARGTNPIEKNVALLVQSDLAKVGINAKMVLIENAVFGDEFYNGPRVGIFIASWSNLPAIDSDFVLSWFSNTKPGRLLRYDNAVFEKAYQASTTELNPDARRKLLQQANAILRDDPPVVFGVQNPQLTAHKKQITGFLPRADGLFWFDPVALTQ